MSAPNKKRATPNQSGPSKAKKAAHKKTGAAALAWKNLKLATTARGPEQAAPAFVEKVEQAMRVANNNFSEPAEITARYAHSDSVREFIEQQAPNSADSEIIQSRASAEQSAGVSRIDDLLIARQNRRAAEQVNAGASLLVSSQAGPLPRSAASALQDDSVWTIDKLANRVLGLDSIDGLDNDLYANPYQLSGLSVKVPNPDVDELRDKRGLLEHRLEELRAERLRLCQLKTQSLCGEGAREAIANDLRLQAVICSPIESVQLLKPASVVRDLNERWRNLLGNALVRIYTDYERETLRTLREGEQSRNVLSLYRENVLNPVLNRYVEQLHASTYEDMPLTSQVLQSYFDRFVTIVLRSLIREEEQLSGDELARIRAAQIEQAGKNYAFAFDSVVRNSVHALNDIDLTDPARPSSALEDEERVVNEYLRQALFIHATRDYLSWLEKWLADVRGRVPDLPEQTIDTLRGSVRAMVEGRERLTREQEIACGNRVLAPYAPPDESEIVRAYSRLVQADVAFSRAKTLLTLEEDDDELRNSVQRVLGGLSNDIPLPVLLHPRIDRFEIVEQERAAFEQQLRTTFATDANERQLDPVSAGFQNAALQTELTLLAERTELARSQLLFYAPLLPEQTEPHGPGDNDAGDWSPYDLSYPLDVSKTKRQYNQLGGAVLRQSERFDAAELHDRANRLRATLSYGYADRLVQREISRIDYLLDYMTLPTRAAPLELELGVHDVARPLPLEVKLELRDELKLADAIEKENNRGGNGGGDDNEDGGDERLARVRRELAEDRFEVVWYFKPRYNLQDQSILVGEPERELAREQLPRGVHTAKLLVPAGDGTTLALAGLYRAEFIGANGTVYKSRFTASVRVFARCLRDGVRYEVGTDEMGGCHWSEVPRDIETSEFVEEVRTLVQSGDAGLEQLLEERQQRKNLQTPEFVAPWGDDSEQSIVSALGRLSTGTLMPEFHYNAIVGRIFTRLASLVRGRLVASDKLRAFAKTSNNLQLVSLLVGAVPEDAPLINAAAQVVVFLHEPEFALDGVGGFALPDIDVDKLERDVEVHNVQVPPSVFDSLELFDFPTRTALIPLGLLANTTNNVATLPLASAIDALFKPAVWQNLGVHEQRFARELFQRFSSFVYEYSGRARRSAIEKRNDFLQFVPDNRGIGDNSDCKLRPRWPGDSKLEHDIDERLARMMPEIVERTARSWNEYRLTVARLAGDSREAPQRNVYDNILLDHSLFEEFRDRVVDLARRGLVSVSEFATEQAPVASRQYFQHYQSGTEGKFSNARLRRQWTGEHSFSTTQPDRYLIEITEDGSGGIARIVRRGSIPENVGYDFRGFHSALVTLVARYNTVYNDTAMSAAARERLLKLYYTRVRDIELIYNFLAFAAHKHSARFTVAADDFLPLDNGDYFIHRAAAFDYLREIAN